MSKRITSNGVVPLGVGNGNQTTLAASEAFGTATVTPGYINTEGNFFGFKDQNEVVITFTAPFQIVQFGGIGIKYAVSVGGSDAATNILIEEFPHGR